jgi:hypothetical protein
MIVRKWNATWPVGFLIAVVILVVSMSREY